MRGSTRMTGHGAPFTMMTSPQTPELSRWSNIRRPSAANWASSTVSATSNSPWGRRARFLLVVDVVVGREPGVDVLGGDVLRVVVVPDGSRGLVVRVVIRLHPARHGQVGGIADANCGREAEPCRCARQLHRVPEGRVRGREVVAYHHLGAGAAVDFDGRSGGQPVIPELWREQSAAEDPRIEGLRPHLVLLERAVAVDARRERDETWHRGQDMRVPARDQFGGHLAHRFRQRLVMVHDRETAARRERRREGRAAEDRCPRRLPAPTAPYRRT